MIAKLTGIVDSVGADSAIIDVGGVGYLVHCSSRTLGRLGGARAAASLAVETTLREDAIVLYGFAETEERDWFRLLQTVQGVGGRVALAVLSALSPDRLAAAIVTEDRAALTQAEGVGPKLAARIIAELKDKAGRIAVAAMPPVAPGGGESGALADAISALVNLGYGRAEAHTAVARAARLLGSGAAVTALVPAALRELAQ